MLLLTIALPIEDSDVVERYHPTNSVSTDAQDDQTVPNIWFGQERNLEKGNGQRLKVFVIRAPDALQSQNVILGPVK